MKLGQVIKKVPGFRSGSKIKAIIASAFYILAIFFILLIIIPTPKSETSQIEEQPTPIPSIETTPLTTPEVKGEQTQEVLVVKVIDGDTIEIEGGKRLRYIGIDTPESAECFANAATDKNKELVLEKKIRMEKDVSETDKYGRLLRYVWVGNIFVNDYLVKQGYAQSSTYPPDVKYQDQFLEAQKEARENNRGLWGTCSYFGEPETKPTPKTVVSPTPSTQAPTTEVYTCDCSKTCPEMSSCDEAYYQLNTCGCAKRDGDKDGVPCENICPGG